MSVHVAVVRAGAEARLRNALVLGGLVLWMVYTRIFWAAQAMHVTVPPCPFLAITHHPCPFCGGTRSFAYMWEGNTARAAALYPLGPLLFFATLAVIPALGVALLIDRDLVIRVPDRLRHGIVAAGLGILGASWALKLTVLPN
ncbi:MAG TPA: DUF2752 domain-containing protein [Candidatus Dormibacteraeota bacterium]|nr:DUF2752 domain-containing protein [Candidatus Dormibacteraeota bacterium]